MPITRISPKRQITIPAQVFQTLQLEVGDYLEACASKGALILRAQKFIPKSQAWFWTKEWQAKEREADQDIKAGRVKKFTHIEDLIKDLRT